VKFKTSARKYQQTLKRKLSENIMTYNIMGINPGHNGSVALVSDGELVYYIEEERLSRKKYDGNPMRGIIDILSKWHVDEVYVGGTNVYNPTLQWTGEEPNAALVRKFNPNVKVNYMYDEHHIGHAAGAFYNSGFDKAISIVVDGAGSFKREQIEENQFIDGFETESIWLCSYPHNIQLLHKTYALPQAPTVQGYYGIKHPQLDFDDAITVTKSYEAATDYLGFHPIEAGKTMGLASYGKEDLSIPELYKGNRGSKDIFFTQYPAGATINIAKNSVFEREHNPKDWHKDPSKLTDIEKNLAWKIQQETQRIIGDYIEFAVNKTGVTNVCISGGYGLNCVANYYFKKRFPKLNFYNEPMSHDGGTSVGIAKLGWYVYSNKNSTSYIKHPQKNIYTGPQYSTDYILSVLNSTDGIALKSVTYQNIANLISDKNIVAMYQGRSEAGPRALGNRSILYDPTDVNGKDFVNTVKNREWFRPFAGSILKEHATEWFDMAGIEESPFMMYAVDVLEEKKSIIPSITHVDGTCRIQTVTEDQNKHYYNLIKEFGNITGVPIIFNTSFNLAGDPLVETINDALDTIFKCKIKYLYLPEIELLVIKQDNNGQI
jgi:carbamoyltransferase